METSSTTTTLLKTIAKLCSLLRKAKFPTSAVETVQPLLSVGALQDIAGYNYLLCTIGAAHRQKGEPAKALEYATRSIEIPDTSWHPYRLAGAACFDLERYDEGEEYFNKAIEKGANPKKISAEKEQIRRRKELIDSNEAKPRRQMLHRQSNFRFESDEDSIDKVFSDEFKLTSEELSEDAEFYARTNEDGWPYED